MKTLFATKDGFIFSFLGKGGNIRAPWLRKIAGQLQPRRHRQGYLTISVQGKQKFIHRLVWEEFNGVIPKGLQINHKDGNKSNNHIDNLELLTPGENQKHAYQLGLKIRRVGALNGNYKGHNPVY